jgi:copper chaperone
VLLLYPVIIFRTLTSSLLYGVGVKDSSICFEEQTVFVVAEPSLSYETVLGAIKAKGKNVRSGEADGVAQTV